MALTFPAIRTASSLLGNAACSAGTPFGPLICAVAQALWTTRFLDAAVGTLCGRGSKATG